MRAIVMKARIQVKRFEVDELQQLDHRKLFKMSVVLHENDSPSEMKLRSCGKRVIKGPLKLYRDSLPGTCH